MPTRSPTGDREVRTLDTIKGNHRAGFEGDTTINRKDWGLTWNAALEAGGVLVSDKVKLEFDISAIKG
jgi:polyisoprenoid-binding protein YceI